MMMMMMMMMMIIIIIIIIIIIWINVKATPNMPVGTQRGNRRIALLEPDLKAT
jgi:hypothetical protein